MLEEDKEKKCAKARENYLWRKANSITQKEYSTKSQTILMFLVI
jgi:hypothetical protein